MSKSLYKIAKLGDEIPEYVHVDSPLKKEWKYLFLSEDEINEDLRQYAKMVKTEHSKTDFTRICMDYFGIEQYDSISFYLNTMTFKSGQIEIGTLDRSVVDKYQDVYVMQEYVVARENIDIDDFEYDISLENGVYHKEELLKEAIRIAKEEIECSCSYQAVFTLLKLYGEDKGNLYLVR